MHCQKLKTYMETGRVVFLPARSIQPNPEQPRRVYGEEALQELARSIQSHGILQPLSVRRVGSVHQLVCGERRLRAAILAGLTDVPCIVVRMEAQEQATAALVENLQRCELNFLEEARALAQLTGKYALRQEQVAQLIGKSQSAVANKLRILRHSEAVLTALREAELTERHGRALLKLATEEEKLAAIGEILRQGMNVARTEKYVEMLLEKREDKPQKANVGAFLNNLTQSLQKIQLSGIPAVSERRETDSQIVLTITIPK